MSQFSASNKKNPCPICGSTDNGCKTQASLILCRTFAGTKKFDYVNEHKCLGHSKDKTWAKFIHQSEDAYAKQEDFTPEQKAAWRQQQEQLKADRKAQAELGEQIAASKSLKSYERNKLYLEILNELSLHPDDRADLKRRGFTDLEIELCGFKSVEPYQRLNGNYPITLPGIINKGFTGCSLSNDAAGYLCPIRNYYGNIVAFQIRLRESNGGSRYKWQSTPKTAILKLYPEGQNPLAVFRPSDNEPEPSEISLVEGVGAKPFLASRRLNSLVIGAAGGQFLSSDKFLREYILSGINDYPTLDGSRKIVIYPDAGDINNPSVMNRIRNLIEHLGKLAAEVGLDIKIAWWGQLEKGKDPDIDELTDLSLIKHLTPRQFLLSQLGSQEQQTQIPHFRKANTANPLDQLREDIKESRSKKYLDTWLKNIEMLADRTVNMPEFSFVNIASQYKHEKVAICVKSPMGTNKTGAMLEVIKCNEAEGIAANILANRNRLLFQVIYRGEEILVKIYHINEDGSQQLIADSGTHKALCPESVHKLRSRFEGTDLHIDEVSSVFRQISLGGTVKGRSQTLCMEVMSEAIRSCRHLYVYDANLSNLEIDLIRKLDPSRKIIVIKNEHPPRKQKITFIHSVKTNEMGEIEIKDRDKSGLISMLLFASKEKPFVMTDSKTQSEVLDGIFRDEGRIGFCLNSDSASETWEELFHKNPEMKKYSWAAPILRNNTRLKEVWSDEMMTNPNEFIQNYQPDYIIVSPTAECGVSITIKWFTLKAAFFCGTITTNSQTQILFRVRDNTIPCYVFCPKRSLVPRETKPYMISSLEECIREEMAFNMQELGYLDCAEVLFKKAIQRANKDWWDYSLTVEAETDFEKENLRACLVYALQKMGHEVDAMTAESSKEINDDIKDRKEEIIEQEAMEIYEAPTISKDEADKLAKKNPNKPTRRAISKAYFLDRLSGISSDDVWSPDFIAQLLKNRDYINQNNNFWLLYHPEMNTKKNQVDWLNNLTEIYTNISDLRKATHSYIKASLEIGVKDLIEALVSGEKICVDSPEVQNIITSLKNNKKYHNLFNFDPKSPKNKHAQLVYGILYKFGVFLIKDGENKQIDRDGIRKTFYVLDKESFEHPYRKAILEARERYFLKWDETHEKPEWAMVKAFNCELDRIKDPVKRERRFEDLKHQYIGDNKNPVKEGYKELIKECVEKGFFDDSNVKIILPEINEVTPEQAKLDNTLSLIEECCDINDLDAAIYLLESAGDMKKQLTESLSIKAKKILSQALVAT